MIPEIRKGIMQNHGLKEEELEVILRIFHKDTSYTTLADFIKYRELLKEEVDWILWKKKQKPMDIFAPRSKKNIIGEDIYNAKQVPIKHYLNVEKNKIKCPLHEERTPSFQIYERDNRWYCFGCNEGGDVIDLVQKLQNITFVEAVKNLIKN